MFYPPLGGSGGKDTIPRAGLLGVLVSECTVSLARYSRPFVTLPEGKRVIIEVIVHAQTPAPVARSTQGRNTRRVLGSPYPSHLKLGDLDPHFWNYGNKTNF